MKANRLSGLLLFLILIATAFRLSARAGEPSYNGKPLSEWLLKTSQQGPHMLISKDENPDSSS
jgi:hypothetical protein